MRIHSLSLSWLVLLTSIGLEMSCRKTESSQNDSKKTKLTVYFNDMGEKVTVETDPGQEKTSMNEHGYGSLNLTAGQSYTIYIRNEKGLIMAGKEGVSSQEEIDEDELILDKWQEVRMNVQELENNNLRLTVLNGESFGITHVRFSEEASMKNAIWEDFKPSFELPQAGHRYIQFKNDFHTLSPTWAIFPKENQGS